MAKAGKRVLTDAKIRRIRTLPASIPVIALVRGDRRVELYQSVRSDSDFYNNGSGLLRNESLRPPEEVMLSYLEHWLPNSRWKLIGLSAETSQLGLHIPSSLTLAAHASVSTANQEARLLGWPMFFVDESEVAQSLGLRSLTPPLTISVELLALLERIRTNVGFSIKHGSSPRHARPIFVELVQRIDDLLWCLRKQATRQRLWHSATGTAEFLERLFIWSRGVIFSGLYHVVQSISTERVSLTQSSEAQR